MQCITLVYIEKNDLENQKIISLEADTRIAWGGQDAIESILSLGKKFYTEDKFFFADIEIINEVETDSKKCLWLYLSFKNDIQRNGYIAPPMYL